MDILSEVYYKSAAENERNFRFWENYLESLKSLDFSIYSDKLKVLTLVPIGSRISFRGELKHTNEVTVALGADYFVKCSVKQAELLRQHRIKDAQSKVDMFYKEKEYLENQMSFTRKTIYDNQGKEIIEYYSEEDDKAWRKQHRENVRHYKQNKGKAEKVQTEYVADEELWNRLEELELQEELENQLSNDDNIQLTTNERKANTQDYFIDKLEEYIKFKNEEVENEETIQEKCDTEVDKQAKKVTFKENKTIVQISKLDKLQQVIDKQKELEEQLCDLKNRVRSQIKSEIDLMSRLDELEQLDELEDEMDRLDDVINHEKDEKEDEDTNNTQECELEKRVSFFDEDASNTLDDTNNTQGCKLDDVISHEKDEEEDEDTNNTQGCKSDDVIGHEKDEEEDENTNNTQGCKLDDVIGHEKDEEEDEDTNNTQGCKLDDVIGNEKDEEEDEDTNNTQGCKLGRNVSFFDEDDSNTLDDTNNTQGCKLERKVSNFDDGDSNTLDDTNNTQESKLRRRVSFFDEDDSNTLEITFKHSPTASNNEPYNSDKGIQKPSDIHEAHSKVFGNKTTSILKKSKYGAITKKRDTKAPKKKVVLFDTEDCEKPETIVMQDFVTVTEANPKELKQARPTSLFKKKRMQNKSKEV